MTLGERIKTEREKQGMSQLELAKKCGYNTKSAISLIESDKREVPLEKVRKIANALNVNPTWLMGWTDATVHIKTDLDITIETIKDMSPKDLERIRAYAKYLKFEGMNDENA